MSYKQWLIISGTQLDIQDLRFFFFTVNKMYSQSSKFSYNNKQRINCCAFIYDQSPGRGELRDQRAAGGLFSIWQVICGLANAILAS